MAYKVPIASPQSPALLLSAPPTGGFVNYDIGSEFPNDPLRMWLAWVNILWTVVGVYNGR